ncbi:MAG: DNA sulfur modification protein DndD [Acidimicrobiaceae bacterium]|nr:DNA sulfur modification protein DndD [Acidimicrobiaceae bacterium]MXW74917.1 DNA sulfur modification protein DndD [Acidimicrobiaceae bacterium]MYA74733.1 DNA sulfur modification protein DndD [Acidimicrobiaceae bacterium]MYC42870.1 DNA sulfur modification protein DndD [Acidimicrobiaceae bacterium]MYD06714.1 DNA sulfur modification protein DndD [Acidimicrobiaceae bacterium]
MLLRSLTLNNFGVYQGLQTVRFSTEQERPITLIGGRNGTGKTSILDSIPLCLYGKRARRILNGSSYPEYLNSMLHHGERAASIALEFDRIEQGQVVRYVVERTWNRTTRGRSTDHLSVSTNEQARPDLVAVWPEFVEGVMPLAVSYLTIFDGEKIESLADPTSSAETLRTSLYGLLGLDLVDRLRSDLLDYRRRTAKAQGPRLAPQLADELARAEEQLAQANQESRSASQALADAESARTDLETQLQNATDKLAIAGGDLLARRDPLRRGLAEANAIATTVERELIQLAAGDLPLTLVPTLLKQVASAGEQNEASHLALQIRTAMAVRDDRVLESLETALGFGEQESQRAREVLRTDLESLERPVKPTFSPTLECADAARNLLNLRSVELRSSAARLTKQLEDLDAEIEDLGGLLAAVPEPNSVVPSVRQVATAEAELRAAKKAVERAQAELVKTERRVDQAQKECDVITHEMLDAGISEKNAARVSREVVAANEVLAGFAKYILHKHLGKITDEIDAALATLLRKQLLVSGVEIDHDDLTVTLRNTQRELVHTQGLSAGENQMIATAVLWGLSRSTGMDLPTIIDTPVGRLDRSHRTNLIRHYFPKASRQVVLLSTDQEIIGDHLDLLRPHIGIEQCLVFNETDASTTVTMGYFDE